MKNWWKKFNHSLHLFQLYLIDDSIKHREIDIQADIESLKIFWKPRKNLTMLLWMKMLDSAF